MAVEVFHNLRSLKNSITEFKHLVKYDKFLIVTRGKFSRDVVDVFGLCESKPKMEFLITYRNLMNSRGELIKKRNGLLEREIDFLWNLTDSYAFGFDHDEEPFFNYQISDSEIVNDLDKVDLLKRIARLS